MDISNVGKTPSFEILDRLIEVTKDPVISAIAFAVLATAVTAILSPLTAVVIASTICASIACVILLGCYHEFEGDDSSISLESDSDDEVDEQNIKSTIETQKSIPDAIPEPKDADSSLAVLNPLSMDAPIKNAPIYEIKMGIPNIGNSCWLNSSLKFIATTDYFDSMLTTTSNEEHDTLRQALHNVVMKLRHGSKDRLSQKIYQKLTDEIKKHIPVHSLDGTQKDPVEFIHSLINLLKWNPEKEKFQAQYVYKSHNERKVAEFPENWYYHVSFLSSDQETPDASLHGLVTREDLVFLRTDIEEEAGYVRSSHFSKLPDHLFVLLNRGVWDQNGNSVKIQTLLRTENGIIKLAEEKTDGDKTIPTKLVSYKIESAIVHDWGCVNYGHYVCHTRSDDKLVRHSDTHLTEVTEEHFGVSGYLLHLKKCDEEILNQGQ